MKRVFIRTSVRRQLGHALVEVLAGAAARKAGLDWPDAPLPEELGNSGAVAAAMGKGFGGAATIAAEPARASGDRDTPRRARESVTQAPTATPAEPVAPKAAPAIDWSKIGGRVAPVRRKIVTEDTPLPDLAPPVVTPIAPVARADATFVGKRWCGQCDMSVTAHEVTQCKSAYCKAPRS